MFGKKKIVVILGVTFDTSLSANERSQVARRLCSALELDRYDFEKCVEANWLGTILVHTDTFFPQTPRKLQQFAETVLSEGGVAKVVLQLGYPSKDPHRLTVEITELLGMVASPLTSGIYSALAEVTRPNWVDGPVDWFNFFRSVVSQRMMRLELATRHADAGAPDPVRSEVCSSTSYDTASFC